MTEQTGTFSPPPGAGPGPSQQPPRATLHRSRTDRKVAGVAGGLAAYFGIDPIILRIFIVVLSLFGGSGLLIYAAGWLLLPDEGEQRSEVQKLLDRDGRPHSARSIVVLTLVIIGIVVAIGSIADGHWWLGGGPGIWPLLVVGGIATLVWYSKRQPGAPQSGPFAAPQAPYVTQPTVPYAAQPPYVPQPTYQPTVPYAAQPPYVPQAQAPWVAPVPKPKRQRSVLGALTLSVAVIAAGVMLPFSLAGVWHVHVVPFLAILLAIIGIGLLVGTFVGRSRGLIAWGVLLSLVVALAAAVPAIDAKGTGDVFWRPTTSAAIPAGGYQWAAGDARLDLTALPPGTGLIRVQLGAGRVLVTIPADARLVISSHVGVGTTNITGVAHQDGIGRRVDETIDPLLAPGVAPSETIELRVEIGAGNLEVVREKA